MESVIIFNLFVFGLFCDLVLSGCPLSDPECHPLCVEYVGQCKYCRCNAGMPRGSDNGMGSGSTLSNKWSSSFSKGSSSIGGEYIGEQNKNRGENSQNTKFIIIHEKERETNQMTSLPGLPMGGHMTFNVPHGPMTAQNPFSHQVSRGHSMNVPMKSPGIPKYCVSVDKMRFEDCRCTVVDEDGCLTCPCYSASRFWIAVQKIKSKSTPAPKKTECIGTMLCMISCKSGYHLGATGPDGCQSCTCLKTEQKTTTPPRKQEKGCLKLYECIIKCSNEKLGFTVGEETADGCRSCKCIGNENNSGGSSGIKNSGGSMMKMFGNTNGGGNSGSQSTKGKCNPPMVMCTNDGNTMMQTMPGGSGSSTGSKSSSSGGSSGGGQGPFNPMGGGSGSGSGMKSLFGTSSGGSGSGAGMKSPFGPSAGGSGSGAGMKSPFTGGGPGKGMGGGPGMGGMGPHGPPNPGYPSQKKVEKTAYNENCFGPSCSAKDGGLIEGSLSKDLILTDF